MLYMSNPLALAVKRIFEVQIEIDPLLQPVFKDISVIWDAGEGLSDRDFYATIELLLEIMARMMKGYKSNMSWDKKP